MTDRYVKLLRSIWNDDTFRALTITEQWLYIALISQPDVSSAGVLPLVERRWARLADDADVAAVTTALDTLTTHGFVVIDDDTGEVWVRSYIRHDKQWASPNGRKSIVRAISSVLSTEIADLCRRAAAEHGIDEQNPRSEGPTEAPPQAPPRPPSEGGSALQQPAARDRNRHSSQQPADRPLTRTDPDDPPAAAAIIDAIIGIRLSTERNIRNPSRYRAALARDLPAEHGDRIDELTRRFPTAPVSAIAAAIVSDDTRQLATYATPEPAP